MKARYELFVEKIPLKQVRGWVRDADRIRHESGKYFSVLAVEAEIGNREVPRWTQPMASSAQEGIIAFITRRINGVLHFLVQAKIEAGNLDVVGNITGWSAQPYLTSLRFNTSIGANISVAATGSA